MTTTIDHGPLVLAAPQPLWATALEPFAGMRGGHSTLPILNCVLVQFLPDDAQPSLVRSDRERQLRVRLGFTGFQVEGRGELAIDAKKLTDWIKALPSAADVRLAEGKARVTLTAWVQGRKLSQVQLGFYPGGDFPLMSAPQPRGSDEKAAAADQLEVAHTILAVPGDRLAAAIARVGYAMAKQDVRYYLNGLLFQWRTPSTLVLAATDGHQLACMGQQAGIARMVCATSS